MWNKIVSPSLLSLILSLALIACPVAAEQSEAAQPPEESWQALLESGDTMYKLGNYKDALHRYEQAFDRATASNVKAPEIVQCMRYLADCYCRVNEPDKAMPIFEQIDAKLDATDLIGRAQNLNDEAYCLSSRNDYGKAETLCRSALKLCTVDSAEGKWQLCRTQAHLAYLDYLRARYVPAIAGFQQAEKSFDNSGLTDLRAQLLRQRLAFAQAGSYYHLARFEDAYHQFKRMYDDDVRLFGKTDLQTGWAMLALSDVSERINRNEEAEDWYKKAIYVFRKFNCDRICAEYAAEGKGDLCEEIKRRAFGKNTVPGDLQEADGEAPLIKDKAGMPCTHDPCAMYVRPFTDAPARVWLNPLVKSRAIIIAVHGLSLQHTSFEDLGRKLADQGFTTVAFDVRGFGTYTQALGADQLDFAGCMHDLQLVVEAIKTDNPGKPVFILGESMGGAIALQFAAKNPNLVDGLIASVPAGKRFKERRRKVKVAFSFLENKNRPINIGTDVINQATTDPRVRQSWGGDPLTRGNLSARELLAFQKMTDNNVRAAKQIRSMPVIIFQGVSDGLVKPDATYDLFRAVTCKDKSFVMVGNAEHLIFEENCFTPCVLTGLVAWMNSQIDIKLARAF